MVKKIEKMLNKDTKIGMTVGQALGICSLLLAWGMGMGSMQMQISQMKVDIAKLEARTEMTVREFKEDNSKQHGQLMDKVDATNSLLTAYIMQGKSIK